MHPDSLRTCMDVAAELVQQPRLFLEFDETDGLSAPATDPIQRYTGQRATLNDERLLKVGALRLLGASDREIERACGVTRRTIPLLLAALEKSGRITPLKDRLAALCGDNAERSNIALRYLLDKIGQPGFCAGDTDLASMIKAVATALGITTEKVLLLTGQATEIIETRVAAGREEFESWWRDSVTVGTAVDLKSGAPSPIPQQNEGVPALAHAVVTPEPTGTPPAPADPDRGGGGQLGAGAGESSTH